MREVLGEVIGKVFSSVLPVDAELVLLDASAHPVEAHVKSFGELPAHVAGEYAMGGRVFGLDWGGQFQLPISMRASQMGTACWPLRKIAPVLASEA